MSSAPLIAAPEKAIAQYNVYFCTHTNLFHYDAWVLVNGRRVESTSGCSIGPLWFGYNRASCTRQAKRAAKRLLRLHLRSVTEAQNATTGTITLEEIA